MHGSLIYISARSLRVELRVNFTEGNHLNKPNCLSSLTLGLSQSLDGSLGSDGSRGAQHVSTTSHDLLASQALPDTGGLSLHAVEKQNKISALIKCAANKQGPHLRVLSAEGAAVLGVLGDFHLLDDLSERSTVSGTVFTANSDLDCVLSLRRLAAKY